jgi:alpha-1,2-mannosyltransferase
LASTDVRANSGHRLKSVVLPLVLLLAVFGIYVATTERHAVNTDAYAASAGAWRIATAGTPWFDGLDVAALDGTHETTDGGDKNGQWLSPSANGHVTAQRMAGPILAGVPFYWVSASGGEESDFSIFPGGVAASMLSALAVMLIFLTLRRRVSTTLALCGALVFAFATPTWSTSANGLWTHPVTQLGIAGAAYALSRDRWWLVGVFLGLGMFGRPHIALIAAVLGLGLAWSRRDWRVAVSVALPSIASLGLLATWNRSVHGLWSIGGAYSDALIEKAAQGIGTGGGYDQLTNYLGFLVSLDRGFLIWSPVVLMFLPAVLRARRELPDWSIWLALGGVVYTFFQLRLNYFAGGVGFHSYRHGLELLTCLVPALTFTAPYLGRIARPLMPVVIAAQFAAFTVGAIFEAYFVDLDEVWTDNSFWLALRHNPEVLGGWLAIAVAVGALVSVRYMPRPPSSTDEPVPERHAVDASSHANRSTS